MSLPARRERASRLGAWICVDGVEAAGKTTITNGLAGRLGAAVTAEFSDAPFGRALREAVQTAPHYISGSPLGQSLVFLGDFIELYETRILPTLETGANVLTDRGYLSKHAYQAQVLRRAISNEEANRLLRHVLGFLPTPRLTIYLTAAAEVIRQRLIRREGHCDDDRIRFIQSADLLARDRLQREPFLPHVIISTERDPADVINQLLPAVTKVLATE